MVESTVESVSKAVVDLTEKELIRVLHVDDETGFLKSAKQCLELQGAFEVETASSVEKAMEIMKAKTFDVVVSDYVLPGKSGLEFLKELRDIGNNIPFIMFTGKGREDVAIKALNLGANRYINKIGKPETVYYEIAHGIRQAVERKRAGKALLESEERFRELTESISDVFFAMDKDFRYTYWNKASERLTGISAKNAIGKSLTEVFPDVKGTKIEQFYSDVLRTKQHQTLLNEYRVGDKDFAFEIDAYPTENGLSVFVKDITERKKMETKIREQNEFLNNALESLTHPFYVIDAKDYTVKLANSATGLGSVSEKSTCYGLTHKREKPCSTEHPCPLEIVKKSKKPAIVEHTHYDKEGNPRNIEVHGYPIFDDAGNVVQMIEYCLDITERKRVREKLQESEEKYRSMVELAPVAISTLNLKGVVTSCNTFTTISGYSKDEIIGKHFSKIGWVQLRDLPKYLKIFNSIIRGKVPEPFEISYRHKNGELRNGRIYVSLMKRRGKTIGLNTILMDITELKRREATIRESQQKLERVFVGNPEASTYVDSDFHISDINPRFEELFGYSLDEIRDKHIDNVIVPKDMTKEAETLNQKAKKGYVYRDTVRKRKDGSLIHVSISVAPVVVEGKRLEYVAVYKDISQLKNAEKVLKESLEKLDVVGKLTRHDVRNKLSAVANNVYLAKQRLSSDSEALKYLGDIESACEHVERIFDFARTYEKLGMEELAYMNVEKALKEATMLLSDLHGVKVVNNCHGLTVLADSLLRQLLYNLVDNSPKHGEKVSQIRVYYEEDGKDKLKLVYEDDGIGLPKAEKEKIFEEGYGKGTGYGLYLIRKMCEVYGWTIKETGKQGKGAQFTITIPKINESGKIAYKLH